MSSWEVATVRAGYDDRDTEIIVEGGNGWGGDGECYHTVLLNIGDIVGEDRPSLLLLTSRDARKLADMITSVADAADERLIREGYQGPPEDDKTVEVQISMECRIDTDRFMELRKKYAKGECGREEMIAYLRYLHEKYPDVYSADPDKWIEKEEEE